MKKRYWVVSPNVSNKSVDEPIWKKVITEKNIAFMGWYEDHDLGYKFKNDIKKGDFILIAQGGNQNKRLFTGGIVSTDAIWEAYNNTPEKAYNRFLEPFLTKIELENLKLDFTNSAFGAAERIPSLYELHPNRNDVDKKIADKIELALKLKIEKKEMQDKIDLLEYKKQIILQGPPGTGKTRLAKMIAHDLTKAQKSLTPYEYVQYYIENYKESIQSKRYDDFFKEKLNEFTEEFPKESIINLSLERYCLGRGTNNSFCYWIEKGLKDLGRFSPGQAGATVYGVYYSKDETKYISAVDGKTPEESIVIIREALSDLIVNENYKKARAIFRFSFILKILNSYYPDKYFPIVSQKHLHTVAKIFNLNVKNLNDVEINQSIKDKFTELKEKNSSSISMANLMGHLYQKFKIKDNQIGDVLINEVAEIGEVQLIQFHPSYTYEDFVRGIVVETNIHNQPEYKVVNKTLAIFAKKALDNSTANYVLIIDEINRANLSSVLGELIYALEYRYDEDAKNEKETVVESMYDLKENEDDETGNKTLMLPKNLYIIGTMNTADRSVGHLDYAIKRRFAFVNVLPEIEPVHPLIKQEFIKISNLFVKDFDGVTIPDYPENSESLASDFKPEDIWIGHSYFICKKENSNENEEDEIAKPILQMKLQYEIIPLLKEYIKDGILLETEQVKTVMHELVSKRF